jgi:hypothetical protein
MTGAIAANFHEGSRSEYLAQYIFASFGTAVAVPHQEDSGIDLNCTLAERVGQRARTSAYFSVQVKSEMKPWVLDDADSVRWLVEHPLPFFYCVVDKKIASMRLYQVGPRFYAWASPPLPNRLRLEPQAQYEEECKQWKDNETYSLGAPILDMSISDLLDDKFHANAKAVLQYWIDIENENISRVRAGIHLFHRPYKYQTNSKDDPQGEVVRGTVKACDLTLTMKHVKMCVAHLSDQLYRHDDMAGATFSAMLLRYLFKEDYSGLTQSRDLLTALNAVVGKNAYCFEGLDTLLKFVLDKIEKSKDAAVK